MRTRITFLVIAALFAAFTIITQPSAQADTFGSGANTFEISFVNIGDVGNAADTTGYGAVPYEYRIGKYEISQDAITKATASGMADVTAGPWTSNQPAATISWYDAAAFVNWLNTSTGHQAAYDLTFSSSWSMNMWDSANAWTLGGTNLYRHKDAYYFLPSETEWYKAAYYNPEGANYYLYPTASDIAPNPVTSGADAGTAVYQFSTSTPPAGVDVAGGLSRYITMGQGGNVWEWNESAFDGANDLTTEDRSVRGGGRDNTANDLRSTDRGIAVPYLEDNNIGFRVASVPEPSTYALLLITGAGALWWARRRR